MMKAPPNTRPLEIVKIKGPDFHIYGPKMAVNNFPGVSYKKFPDNYCGAGNGIGEKMVPDYIGRLIGLWRWAVKVSPACWAHDEEWHYAPATWDAFYASNGRFQQNLNRMIRQKGPQNAAGSAMMYRATTYMLAVSTLGQSIFWQLKNEQGHEIPESAKKFLKPLVPKKRWWTNAIDKVKSWF